MFPTTPYWKLSSHYPSGVSKWSVEMQNRGYLRVKLQYLQSSFLFPILPVPFWKVKEADPHHILKYFRRESESCFVVLESMWQWQTHIYTLGLLIPNKLSETVLLFAFHYKSVIKLDWGRFFMRCYLPFSWRSLSLSWSVPNFQSQIHKMS